MINGITSLKTQAVLSQVTWFWSISVLKQLYGRESTDRSLGKNQDPFPIGTVPELFLKEPLCIAHHNVRRDPYVVFILPVEQFIF